MCENEVGTPRVRRLASLHPVGSAVPTGRSGGEYTRHRTGRSGIHQSILYIILFNICVCAGMGRGKVVTRDDVHRIQVMHEKLDKDGQPMFTIAQICEVPFCLFKRF